MMAMQKDAAVTLIVGRRGSGKSHLSRAVLDQFERVLAFDPLGEYRGRKGWKNCEDRKTLLALLLKNWGNSFRISYIPPAGQELEALHFVSDMLWQLQSAYRERHMGQKLCLLIEEANLSIPTTPFPRDRAGALRLINQGRHAGIEMVAVTQRPALVSASYRANALRTFIFPLADANDIATVLRMVGRQHNQRLRVLQPFNFFLWENAQFRPGQTLRKGGFALKSPI